jgi:hypothetical protein
MLEEAVLVILTAQSVRVNCELQRTWKEAIVANLMYFTGGIEEIIEKQYPGWRVSRQIFEPGTSHIRSRNDKTIRLRRSVSYVALLCGGIMSSSV